MKGGHRQQPAGALNQAPLSPTSKATAKYKNKDGSKIITVPKGSTPADSSQASPTTTPSMGSKAAPSAPVPDTAATPNGSAQPVNRKKQKRRAKAAAKAAAEQALKPESSNGLPSPPASHEQHSGEAEADLSHDDDDHYADADSQRDYPHQNGYSHEGSSKGKKSKKKKKKNAAASADESHGSRSHHVPPSQAHGSSAHRDDHRPSGMSREKIWDNSNAEERERIKEFWLGLSEEERKSLVKVEKDAVLKKMKEQQKHTCSCTVCGRKRTAIEEELEGLYDAYYQELEHYANHPDERNGPPMLRSHQPYNHIAGGRSRGLPASYSNIQPSHGRIVEHVGDDEDEEGEEGYSEDELDEDDYSDDAEASEAGYRPDYPPDFFNFGNSLTVQGGILTVADDLLKNDGKKFIEMMERLAERRMSREEDAREQFERNYDHVNGDRYAHPHPPPEEDDDFDDDEDYDDEEDEDYDSQEEEVRSIGSAPSQSSRINSGQDTMTEEQRMEEGRRMFQIFAARMFEQRVLSAYREKVAKERQAKLIEELEAESIQESQRKAKKAKEAQKRKEKAAKKKQELASQKADKEAEKAALEAARKEEEARKIEEQRRKAEEKRKKKEAQKKAEEEERQRREAERVRRIHEREEAERKAREQKEREKKLREEQWLKEKQAREQKEQEMREQKERESRERKEHQERDKRERESKAKAAREAKEAKEKERQKQQEERAAHKAAALAAAAVPVPITLPKRPAQGSVPAPVPALPQQQLGSYSSPQISVATPAFPKAPTPMRARQSSQQESTAAASSQSGSGPSQNPSPHPLTPVHASPGPIGSLGRPGSIGIGLQSGQQTLSHPASPLNASAKVLPPQPGLYGMPPMGLSYAPAMPSQISVPPGFANPVSRDTIFPPPMGPVFRPAPGLGSAPSGFGGPIGGRGFPIHPPPGFPGPLDSPVTSVAPLYGTSLPRDSSSHSRQNSGSFEPGTPSAASQPISRPTPIGRPSSVVQGQRPSSRSPSHENSVQEPEPHLGSSALLDDDEPFQDFANRRVPLHTFAPGPRPIPGFPVPYGMDPMFSQHHGPWGPPSAPQHILPPGPPPGLGFGPGPMGMPWGTHLPGPSGFGGPTPMDRPSEPRAVVMRKMLCRACDQLAGAATERPDGTVEATDGFVPLDEVKAKLDANSPDGPVDERFLLAISETEGDHQNGGGSFDMRDDGNGKWSIRWDPSSGRGSSRPIQRAVGAPGDIGSPVVGGGLFGNSR
ncbi:hypothetical protein OQA88_2219 [Cercophora sp. LCS_1]